MRRENSDRRKLVLSILSFLILIVAIFGSSFAVFSLTDGSAFNSISTGSITMSYTESESGISLENALPISDNLGMIMNKGNEYFDFTVSTKASGSVNIPYEINLTEVLSGKNRLSRDKVKIFLTEIINDEEKVLVGPVLVSTLNSSVLREGAMVLYNYTDEHDGSDGTVFTTYRLRIWIDANVDASLLGDEEYKLLVNVYSNI